MHNFYVALAQDKNFNAAPALAPTCLKACQLCFTTNNVK
jgi:hypothetical protein